MNQHITDNDYYPLPEEIDQMSLENERRFQAGRPYIRPRNKHEVSAESDYLFTIIITFIVGSMLGAVVTLGAITTGVISI